MTSHTAENSFLKVSGVNTVLKLTEVFRQKFVFIRKTYHARIWRHLLVTSEPQNPFP